MVKKNLIANYLGQGWVGIMSVVFIPLYIQYLGIEAYGLIGVFSVLTAWLTLLDMGMTPALSREMARFTGGSKNAQSVRDLLRSIEIITLGIVLIVAGGVALSSKWIATSWLRAETLPVEVVAKAFVIMGLITAMRFAESIYRSCIVGLQRQVTLNVVASSLATLRGAGGVAILAWISPTIEAFFLWQGVISIATVFVLAMITYNSLPNAERMARFSIDALRGVARFAVGMSSIAFLALLLTQVDKVLLSTLLTLSDFGYYTLAAAVSGSIFMLIAPVTQAMYPRVCELQARQDATGVVEIYHKGAQLVSVVAGSVAITMILFAETFLRLWTQDQDLAARTASLLSLLMLGNLLNGLMWVPHQTQLAFGWTSLTVKANAIALAVIVPAILWVTPRYGAEGAAVVWVSLNLGYVLIAIPFMHRRILRGEKWRWYAYDLLAPLGAGFATCLLLRAFWPIVDNALSQLLLLSLAVLLVFTAALLAADKARQQFLRSLDSYWRRITMLHGQ